MVTDFDINLKFVMSSEHDMITFNTQISLLTAGVTLLFIKQSK